MNRKEQKKALPKTIYLCCCCFLLLLSAYFVFQKGYAVISCNTPKELREMTTVAAAQQFARMHNPYSRSVLAHDVPAVTSIYGFLVPLLMSPFIRLLSFTQLSTLQICELLTLIVEAAGMIFIYRLTLRKTGNHILSLAGALLFYTCYWRYAFFGGAFPDQWGLTLSIILMDLLHADERKGRFHPLVYAGCIVCLFYIKQYFVLIAAGLCVYLLIHSVKDLKRFILYGILSGCLSVILICILLPLYFSEVFPIAHGQTLTGDPSYSFMQIIKLSLYYGPVVLFAALGLLINGYKMAGRKFGREMITYELCQILFILPPLFRIAENQGTNYTYYLQLWYPYIILYGIVTADDILKHIRPKAETPLCIKAPKTLYPIIGSTLVYLLVALSIVIILPSCRCSFMTKEQKAAWNHAYAILDQYASEGEILVSMLLSDYCLEHDVATSNYGQAEYNNMTNLENYKNNRLWRNIFLFDHTEALLQKNIAYNQSVRDKIYARSYRCIALVYAGEYNLAEDDPINAGYHIIASEELAAGTQRWYTVFYAAD